MTRAALLAYIDNNVYPNANNEITALMVRDVLHRMVDFLGDAATYGVGDVALNNGGLVTGGAVQSAINTTLSSAIMFQGVTTTPLTDGSTNPNITIGGESYTAHRGDEVIYGGKEFLWTGTKWQQLGDEESWAAKTITISAGTGLTGGGNLTQNRTISLSQDSLEKLALAASAYQLPQGGIPKTDLASAVQNSLGKADTVAGYFSNDKLKLQNLPALYVARTQVSGTAANKTLYGVDGISAAAAADANDKSLIEWDSTNSAWHFHGNIYTDGWFSGGGISSGGGGGGGLDPALMWKYLTNDPTLPSNPYANTKIAEAHLPDLNPGTGISASYSGNLYLNLSLNYSAVAGQLGLSGMAYKPANQQTIIDALGYTPANVTALAGYLPLAGGILSNSEREILALNQVTTSTGERGPYLRFSVNGDAKAGVGYNSELGTFLEILDTPTTTKYINVKSDGLYWCYQYVFLHSNNYETYVTNTTDGRYIPEPTSGQTTTKSFRTYNDNAETGIAFKRNSAERFYVGTYADNAYLCVRDSTGNNLKYHRFYYDKVVLDCNLSVGAGNNPAYRLDVDGGNLSEVVLRLNSTRSETDILFAINGTNKGFMGAYSSGVLMYNVTSGNNVHLNDSGYFVTPSRLSVGAGDNPAYMLDVNGEMRTNGGIFGKGWSITGRSMLLLNSNANHPADITFRSGSYTTGTWGDWSLSSRGNEGGSNNSFYIARGAYNAGNQSEACIIAINPDGNVIIGQSVFGATTTHQLDVRGVIHATTGIWTDGYLSGGGLSQSSDQRLKRFIEDFSYNPGMLMALRPREWEWNEKTPMQGHAAGFVAQEVEGLLPYMVDDTREYLALYYDQFHALEVAALQDHERRIVELERAVKERDKKIEKLEKMLKLN